MVLMNLGENILTTVVLVHIILTQMYIYSVEVLHVH
jgi:hypothetical protein